VARLTGPALLDPHREEVDHGEGDDDGRGRAAGQGGVEVPDSGAAEVDLPPRARAMSAIGRTKPVVASNGAAWAAPSIASVLAPGIAEVSDRVRRTMKSGLREPWVHTTGTRIVARSVGDG
jgi:hypothetical protein